MEVTISSVNQLLVDGNYRVVKSLPNQFICKGIVSTSAGNREVDVSLRRKNITQTRGKKCQDVDILKDEYLFTTDLSGLLYPIVDMGHNPVNENNIIAMITYVYEVDVPETLFRSEFYLIVKDDIYIRVGGRSHIFHRIPGYLSLIFGHYME
jgi:hypothetical protein